jgi:RNA polymerase sigma-70 factor, ECF subfamily
MSEEAASFDEVMTRLRKGDQAAAAEVFRRFANRLIGLARTHLDHRLRQKVGPEDVMQSALKSFFVRHADGKFDLAGWDNLWSMLVVITLRKCGHKAEHFRAACRDVGREQPPAAVSSADSVASWEAVAPDPTPVQAALLAEAVEQVLRDGGTNVAASFLTCRLARPNRQVRKLAATFVPPPLKSLGDDRKRQILELALQGLRPVEISDQVGRSERTVQRVLDRVRRRLQRMRDE